MSDNENPYASPNNSINPLMNEKSGEPIYSRGQILCGTFFGGFFCAAMMFRRNFKVSGSDSANKFFYGFIVGGLIVVLASVYVPFAFGIVIGIGSLFVSNLIYDNHYAKLARQAHRDGSKNCSNWKAFGLIVLSICILFFTGILIGIVTTLMKK